MSDYEIDDEGNPVKKEKKIKVEISRDAEIDSLQRDLADAERRANEGDKERIEAEKTQLVLELFEREKELQSQVYPNLKSQIESCHTPQELEDVLAGYGKPRAPAGKASMGEGSVYELRKQMQDNENMTQTELLDSIYEKLNNPKKYSKDEIEFAHKQRRILLENMIKGGVLAEYRRQNRTVFKNKMITYCPNCEKNGILTTVDLNEVSECPKCGQKFYDRNSDRRR